MNIYLNKINNLDQLFKTTTALDGYNNPKTSIKIAKALLNEMLNNIKTKYNVNDERLKDIDEELRLNILNRNKNYFIDKKFNGLITDYKDIIKELSTDKKKQNKEDNKRNNFYDNDEPLNLPDNEDINFEVTETKKFKNSASAVKIVPENNITHPGLYFALSKNTHMNELKKFYDDKGSFKAVINLSVEYKKVSYDIDNNKKIQYSTTTFSSSKIIEATPLLNEDDINEFYKISTDKINNQAENYNNKSGSGWVIDKINYSTINFVVYKAFSGSSYLELPKWVNNKKCCINVNNDDNKCFAYAILSAKYPNNKNAQNVNHYIKHLKDLNMNGINYPVNRSSYELFEKQNNIPINVFIEDKENDLGYEIFYISKLNSEKDRVNLLLIENEDKSHYVWIKNLRAFIRQNKDELHICDKCLCKFSIESAYNNHILLNKCEQYNSEVKKTLPVDGKHINKFFNHHRKYKIPFVIYADCESILKPIDIKKGSGTTLYQNHIVNNVGVKLVSDYPELIKDDYKSFDGENCMEEFLKYLFELQDKILTLTDDRKNKLRVKKYRKDENCCICNTDIKNESEQSYKTGKFYNLYDNKLIDYAHEYCIKKYDDSFKIPVVFHNLRGYDSHLILQAIGKFGKKNISCIPNTIEKYMCFTIEKLNFIDSFQFTLTSLEKLVDGLNKVGDDDLFKNFNDGFKIVEKYYHPITCTCDNCFKSNILKQKGVFPYDFYDSNDKLNYNGLPLKEDFYNKLYDEKIKDVDYDRAYNVYKYLNCNSFGDYVNVYLKTDVLLLADVFEAFRNMCLIYYGLDPCYYVTAPGLSWDAMLKMTKVEIECFKEGQEDMLDMVKRGMRGGISVITHRYAKANNKYMNEYNKDDESSYIIYLDANNLYGYAMSEPLPYGNYKFLESDKFSKDYILNLKDDDSIGYILDVDIDYPETLHDLHNDYPLLPESANFGASPFINNMKKELGLKEDKTNKLIPNLNNKRNYVLHYRNLKQALELGLILVKVNKVISFNQSTYLKQFINFNTMKRTQTKLDYEKDLFKLMNNSVFGKTMENIDKRIDVKLVNEDKKFIKMASKPTFKNFRIFNNDLIAVEVKKTEVVYNKPMIVGMCILDLSKTLMYNYHYNTIKKQYGNNAKLLFTDTDSLTYHIKTNDLYNDMKKETNLYDFSEYSLSHPNYDETNKKMIGKFKDETNGKPIEEFIGLRSKMYSIKLSKEKNKATAKGIKKCVMKNIKHDDYKRCILSNSKEDRQQIVNFNLIRSTDHIINTINVNKIGLACVDDKRYVLDNNIDTLSHGHYKIN